MERNHHRLLETIHLAIGWLDEDRAIVNNALYSMSRLLPDELLPSSI